MNSLSFTFFFFSKRRNFFWNFCVFFIGIRKSWGICGMSDWHGPYQLKFERDFDLEFFVDWCGIMGWCVLLQTCNGTLENHIKSPSFCHQLGPRNWGIKIRSTSICKIEVLVLITPTRYIVSNGPNLIHFLITFQYLLFLVKTCTWNWSKLNLCCRVIYY